MAGAPDPEAVDAYLADLPAPERGALETLRRRIRELVPDATERIAYKIPVFALDGDLVGFASHPKHLSLYTMSPGLVASMKERLAPFRVSGATLHFDADAPLPDDLIDEIVSARVRENAARRAAKRR